METQPNVGPHLTYFKIENFKRFDSFEMSNLGQFNLMVGDNNVGKTSVLEGLCFDEDVVSMARNYLVTALIRNNLPLNISTAKELDLWNILFKRPKIKVHASYEGGKTQSHELSLLPTEQLNDEDKDFLREKLILKPVANWLKVTTNTGSANKNTIISAYLENNEESQHEYMTFTNPNQSYDMGLVSIYYDFFNNNKEYRKLLEDKARLLIPNLEEVRVHRVNEKMDILMIGVSEEKELVPITRYGDGTVKYLRMLMEIIISKGKRLMVDEIGSGIHFTRLVDYWKTVIRLCDQYKVQLFATTHSLECQQAFVEALEAPDMVQYQKDARNISLIENKQGEVKAVTYDFAQFEYALTIGFNTRGGKR